MRKDLDFKASSGWLEKFLNRYNLVNRQSTTICQKPPEEYEEVIAHYFFSLSKMRKLNNYEYIFAADEAGVFIETNTKRTLCEKGSKEVSIITTGHEKVRISVMLTGRSDGYKCRPYVLLPRKRPDAKLVEKYKGKLELGWHSTNWMNNECIAAYLDKIFGKNLFKTRRLLVWDSFRGHVSEETQLKLKSLNIDSVIVPGGCTKFIQAPDTHWNAPFKAKIRSYYEDWMIDGVKEITKGGNTKAPSMDIYLNWIYNTWEDLSTDYIRKSFKESGLTTNTDGTEDNLILCYKKEIPNALEKLKKLREEHRSEELMQLVKTIDFGEDINNGYDSDDEIFEECMM